MKHGRSIRTNRMTAAMWWSSIPKHRFPRWGWALQHFLTPVAGLFSSYMPTLPKVVWSDEVDSAAAVRKENTILLGKKIIGEVRDERVNPNASVIQTCGAVMGALCHEAMHLLKTDADDLLGLLNTGVEANQVATTIANIIEDLYIEDAARVTLRRLFWTIQEAWEYFFPAEDMDENLEKSWDGLTKDTDNLGGILDTMMLWKNRDYVFELRSDFERELNEMTLSVLGMDNFQERKDLIEKVYRFLLEETNTNESELEKSEGEGEGQGGSGGKGEPKPGDLAKAGEVSQTSGNVTSIAALLKSNQEPVQDFDKDKLTHFDMVKDGLPVTFKSARESGKALAFDPKWRKLAELAEERGTVQVRMGTPGNYGNLTHPGRIFDDGRIFSRMEFSSDNGRIGEGQPENIILVDGSGSMGARTNRGVSRFREALAAAKGAMIGLSEGRQQVAVFVHNTDDVLGLGEAAVVYTLKDFGDGIDLGTRRIQGMLERGHRSANADGDALLAVAKKFSDNDVIQNIFIISDGAPSVSSQEDKTPWDVAKEAVADIRKRGINVYSISVEAGAVQANNGIYGEKFNVAADDPNVLAKLVEMFI